MQFRFQAAIFDFSLTSTNGRSVQSCCLTSKTYVYSRWNSVAIMCTSWDIRYFISTSGSRPPFLIFHPPWRRPVLTFIPLCCSMQKICEFRWNFTSAMSGLSAPGVTSAILIFGWTRSNCTQGDVASYSKTNAATLNLLAKLIYAFDAMVTKFIAFSPKNRPPHVHFRWCNSITGWTIWKSQRHSITLWWL